MTRTRLKICGLTRAEDVDAALAVGADALGFVFYPPSPRALTIAQAATLMARVPAFVTKVALFVNAEPDVVSRHLQDLPIDLLQFHGDETAEQCARFQRPWIKAARIDAGFDLLEFCGRYAGSPGNVGVLADAFVDGFGGAGKSFDWGLIPDALPLPLILSGGLNPENVSEAIRRVRPWAVDVSSGVEAPGGPKGIKSLERMQRFAAGVRNADHSN